MENGSQISHPLGSLDLERSFELIVKQFVKGENNKLYQLLEKMKDQIHMKNSIEPYTSNLVVTF
jgi:hypothetical protein